MCVSQTEMKRYLREKDFASQMCLIYIYIYKYRRQGGFGYLSSRVRRFTRWRRWEDGDFPSSRFTF